MKRVTVYKPSTTDSRFNSDIIFVRDGRKTKKFWDRSSAMSFALTIPNCIIEDFLPPEGGEK